ncbi:hypothetical protein K7X08_037123 [Anisodus acutangulus]|uniref:Uncharacterized protein n=1 Tax=Anisodus acutangulus TaxID=402998 RepID=A0A9Q1L6N7_9SOLA|nr:hypothetical protein K7X08_037123 [Anisodus acutangulus]
MYHLPNISKVYSLLQQDESQNEAQSGIPSFLVIQLPSLLFLPLIPKNKNVQQRYSFDFMKSNAYPNSVYCKYCKRSGHTIDDCHRLHGCPVDYKFTKNKKPYASCVQVESSSSMSINNNVASPSMIHSPKPFDTLVMETIVFPKNNVHS